VVAVGGRELPVVVVLEGLELARDWRLPQVLLIPSRLVVEGPGQHQILFGVQVVVTHQ
jgi:hypothetical protein